MHSIAIFWRRAAAAILTAAVVLLVNSRGWADGPQIAQVKTVSGDAVIVRNGARIAAKVGDAVFEKDTIETGDDGAMGLTFTDNTVMSTGPDSEIALDEGTSLTPAISTARCWPICARARSRWSRAISRAATPGAMKNPDQHRDAAGCAARGSLFRSMATEDGPALCSARTACSVNRRAGRLFQPPGAVRGAA